MNQLKLVARMVEKNAVRYTPAGIPIASATLTHSSTALEANQVRQVEFEISALAAGEISQRFAEIELDKLMEFTGFLTRKNRNSKSLVFHVTEFRTHLLD